MLYTLYWENIKRSAKQRQTDSDILQRSLQHSFAYQLQFYQKYMLIDLSKQRTNFIESFDSENSTLLQSLSIVLSIVQHILN